MQLNKIRNVYKQFWYLLTADQKIMKFFKPYPEITYRRSKLLRDTLVTSHHKIRESVKNKMPDTYPCGKCNFCHFILNAKCVILPNNTTWTPRHRTTCQIIGAVYRMKCFCGAFYIWKSKTVNCRIRDHVFLIAKHKMETPISRHVGLYHNLNLNSICFFSIEHIPHHEWCGDIDRKLLQLETRWI